MLDLGANVDCEPTHLLQFAIMGSALASVLDGTERPSVGLLNIGEELIKGNDVVKEAAPAVPRDVYTLAPTHALAIALMLLT